MQRFLAPYTKHAYTKYVANTTLPNVNPCDIFINHRGIDTKKTISGLLYDHFTRLRLNTFLDSKSIKPGDRLVYEIETAIKTCGVSIAVFSPTYCDSYFCLNELALLMENKKRVIPIFWDVRPSLLCVKDDGTRPAAEIEKFRSALKEARYTVGLTFDTSTGDWSKFMAMASDAVTTNLLEVEEERLRSINQTHVKAHNYLFT